MARVQIEMLRGLVLLAQLSVSESQSIVRLAKRRHQLYGAAQVLDRGFQLPGGRFRLAQAVERTGVAGIGRDEFPEDIAATIDLVAGK